MSQKKVFRNTILSKENWEKSEIISLFEKIYPKKIKRKKGTLPDAISCILGEMHTLGEIVCEYDSNGTVISVTLMKKKQYSIDYNYKITADYLYDGPEYEINFRKPFIYR
jgi:hypothetical protein